MKNMTPVLASLFLVGCGVSQIVSQVGPVVAPWMDEPKTSSPIQAPRILPAIPNAGPSAKPEEIAIKIFVNDCLWPASSYLLATNRNHVEEYFPNGAAKIEKLKELKPTWGAQRYMYRIGHGPSDGRYDYDYMTGYHFESCWDKKGGYPYDDIRNALREARTLDSEQIHVINFGTGSPEEAGKYVSYLNNSSDPNRSSHPSENQNARYFELGNEISWSMVRGHNEYASNDTSYAKRAKLFAQAMRKSSSVPIQIGAVATTNSNWLGDGWSGGASTVKNILTTMGDDVDFLIYHGYPSWPMKKDGDLLSVMAQNEWNKKKLEGEILPAIKQYATHPVYLANTEFFTELYGDSAHARGMFGALYSADTLALAFNHDIRIANQFCFDHGDQADASFFRSDDPNKTTPIFEFQKLLAQHWGDQVVRVEGQNIPSLHVQGADDSVEMPKLAFSAARSKDKLFVMVVNRTNDADVTSCIATGLQCKEGKLYRLAGTNGWDSPDAAIAAETVDPSKPLSFPRASISILELPY